MKKQVQKTIIQENEANLEDDEVEEENDIFKNWFFNWF